MRELLERFFDLPAVAWRKWRELSRKLWVRVVMMGMLSLVSLMLAPFISDFLPKETAGYVSGQAADRLLGIIANAMLAVTTFSLTVMVTVYRSSSSQFTPRLHQLIVQDRTTQNTLAAFIGAYVYALTAIILRELQIFSDDRALLLFVMTVIVLIYVVGSMIRWVLHLQTFGSMINTSRQLEDITLRQFNERLERPCLGAFAWDGEQPNGTFPVKAETTGYIQVLYQEALNERLAEEDTKVWIKASVGAFVMKGDIIAFVDSDDNDIQKSVRASLTIGDVRTYEQDPRFGLLAMGEVASKALSPGVNDPGTAIDVLTRQARVLQAYEDETKAAKGDVAHPQLHVRALDPVDLIEDAFGAWSRDGAGLIEVQMRLQKVLAMLMEHGCPEMELAARAFAENALQRGLEALTFEPDKDRLKSASKNK